MISTCPVLRFRGRPLGAHSVYSLPGLPPYRWRLPVVPILCLAVAASMPAPALSADQALSLPPIVVTAPDDTDEAAVPTPVPRPAEEAFRAVLEKRAPKQFVETRGTAGRDTNVKVRTTFGTYCLRYNPLAPRYSIGDNVTVPTNCAN